MNFHEFPMTASGLGVPLAMIATGNKAVCRSMETMHSVTDAMSIGTLVIIKIKLSR
jgi:hypothetical protein